MTQGTIQVERSRFQWVDVYIVDGAGTPETGLLVGNFTVRYKKNNVVAFTTKTLGGISTTVETGVALGVTSIDVVDASVFPLAGSVTIDPGGGNEEIVTFTRLPASDTLTVSTTVNEHLATETVALVDWVNVGVGVYSFLFSASELDQVGQFTAVFTPTAGLQVVRELDIIYKETLGTDPPSSPLVCRVYGYITDLSGEPLERIGVSARVLALPDILSGLGIQKDTVSSYTDSNGYFTVTIIQGATVDVAIPAINYRRTVLVPASEGVDLFSLVSA